MRKTPRKPAACAASFPLASPGDAKSPARSRVIFFSLALLVFSLCQCSRGGSPGRAAPSGQALPAAPSDTVYTVTFMAGGGVPAPAPQTVSPGRKLTQPGPMTMAGSGCAGWYTEPEFTTRWNFAVDAATGDITLYAKWEKAADDVDGIEDYIAAIEDTNDGDSPESPLPLKVNIDLGDMTERESGWEKLIAAIDRAGKYVALDLSSCAMFGTEFNTNYTASPGKDRIVQLILPDAAESIVDMIAVEGVKNFSNLASVEGVHIIRIGKRAFTYTGLQSVNFPAAQDIGYFAFFSCTVLARVSLPSAQNIDESAFAYCTDLESVSFPASTEIAGKNPFYGCPRLGSFTLTGGGALSAIEGGRALVRNGGELIAYPGAAGAVSLDAVVSVGQGAFAVCTGLESLSLQAAQTIGTEAFAYCTGLKSLSLPSARSMGHRVFRDCTGLESLDLGQAAPAVGIFLFDDMYSAQTIRVRVPAGAEGYDEDWKAAFRGKGSDGDAEENTYITVIITPGE